MTPLGGGGRGVPQTPPLYGGEGGGVLCGPCGCGRRSGENGGKLSVEGGRRMFEGPVSNKRGGKQMAVCCINEIKWGKESTKERNERGKKNQRKRSIGSPGFRGDEEYFLHTVYRVFNPDIHQGVLSRSVTISRCICYSAERTIR